MILGVGGVAAHSHARFGRQDPGYFCRVRVCHNVSAVTGACLFVRRPVFDQVGGKIRFACRSHLMMLIFVLRF